MFTPLHRILTGCLLLTVSLQATAQFVMYDFESAWQFEDWTVSDSQSQHVEPSSRFAVSGEQSVHLKAERPDQPTEFRLRLWDNNYEPYDRVAMTLTNVSTQPLRLTVALVSDNDNGYRFTLEVPALSQSVPIKKIQLPDFVRHDNLHFMVFTAEAGQVVDAYLDDIVALRKGDDAPEASHATQATQSLRQAVLQSQLQDAKDVVADVELQAPREMLQKQLTQIDAVLQGDVISDEQTAFLLDEFAKFMLTTQRYAEITTYLDDYPLPTDGGFVVGFADSTRQVMPRHVPTHLQWRETVEISVAGGEKEAAQVVVVPFAGDVAGVNVAVSSLRGPGGEVINTDHVEVDLVGFVQTRFKTTPDVHYVGWWPDPLIDTDEPIEVALGDAQTWWVRVSAPRDQPAGQYTGHITISAAGHDDLTFPLMVQVRDFNVPKHAPIPTAVTFVGHVFKNYAIFQDGGWDQRKFAYTDMLNDYLMNMDSLYRWADPNRLDAVDWELIDYQQEKGTLVSFNFGYFYDASPEKIEALRPYYENAKKRGLLDKAYIYGWDETGPNTWPEIEQATKSLGEVFPEVLTMVTSQDHSYGFNSPLEHLGAWVPIISRYNPTLAAKARKEGRSIWWYTCIWPPHPYPNIFVDYPAIENRVLTGLMHMKYQPDGYLYYATTMWQKPEDIKFIRSYPYTEWITESFPGSNGDGSYFCMGEDGTLIPTLRVENYRDGFEDLAYWMILQHQVKLLKKSPASGHDTWLKDAEAALADINQLVPDRRSWPENEKPIRDYRERLAMLIESSPIADTDPWKNGMGVRGLPRD